MGATLNDILAFKIALVRRRHEGDIRDASS